MSSGGAGVLSACAHHARRSLVAVLRRRLQELRAVARGLRLDRPLPVQFGLGCGAR